MAGVSQRSFRHSFPLLTRFRRLVGGALTFYAISLTPAFANVLSKEAVAYLPQAPSIPATEIARLPSSRWQAAPRSVLAGREPHWFRVRFVSEKSGPHVFSLHGTNIDEVEFFRRAPNGNFETYSVGGLSPHKARAGAGRTHSVQLTLHSGAPEEIFVRAVGRFSFPSLFRVDSMDEFFLYESRTLALIGFHAALTLMGAFFILALGGVLKESRVDAYLLFTLGMLTASLSISGSLNLMFESLRSTPIQGALASIAALLPIFGAVLFTQSFLETRTHFPFFHRLLWGVWSVTLVAVAVRLTFPWNPWIEILSAGLPSALIVAVNCWAGILAFRRRQPQAGYFIAAWSTFLLGVLLFAFSKIGVLEMKFVFAYAPLIAQLGEVILFTIALIKKFSGMFEAKIQGDRASLMLRVLSHDLGNSVMSTKMNLEQMDEIAEGEQASARDLKPLIQDASGSISKVETLLRELREFLALQTRKADVSLQPIGLTWIQQRLLNDFHFHLQKKNLTLSFEGDWSETQTLLADPETLARSVLGNAVSNAVKFSHAGATIRIRSSARENTLRISVEDVGLGIPPELLVKLFDPNAKTSRPGTAGEAGTGFGMPILAAYMKHYKGQLEIDSKVGHGTKVHLTFKRAPVLTSPTASLGGGPSESSPSSSQAAS